VVVAWLGLVDLTCELAAVLPKDDAVTYLSVPILDAGWPEPARLLSTVRTIRDLPRPIYLHCAQGHGRTGLVAAAILLAEGDAKTAEEALNRVRAVRPGVRVNGGQRRALEQLAGLLTFPRPVAKQGGRDTAPW
jgi:protein-tyrosine phosphatase